MSMTQPHDQLSEPLSAEVHSGPIPNLSLLRKVLEHIDAHPDEWEQGWWADRDAQSDCGTAFCIAGHAAVFSGAKPIWTGRFARSVTTPQGNIERISVYAQQELGLDSQNAADLFWSCNTRADVQRIAERIAADAGERL